MIHPSAFYEKFARGEWDGGKPAGENTNGASNRAASKPVNGDARDHTDSEPAASQGDKWERVKRGEWEPFYPSQSEADMGLCAHFAWQFHSDPVLIDKAFRETDYFKLHKRQERWDESRPGGTYGSVTIAKVIQDKSDDDALSEAEAVIRSLKDKKSSSELLAVVRKAVERIARVWDQLKRECVEAQLIAAVKPAISANTIRKLLNEARDRREKEAESERHQAEEAAVRAAPSVDGVQLAEDLVSYYRTYVRTGEDEYTVSAPFVLHCHAFGAFTRTPYMNPVSPTVDCGKTQYLEVTGHVAPRPILAGDFTAALLARTIEEDHPTLLIDEFDETQKGDKDLLSAVMKTLNSGYKKTGKRYVLVPVPGGGWEKKAFSTFCPKVVAGIGSLPLTVKSRSIPINMERLRPGDHVSDPDEWIIEPQAAKLKARAATWAAQHLEELTRARPDSPSTLRNRQREVARPLFAIADAIGGEWPERVRAAVVRLFARRDQAPADDIETELLTDIKEVFDDGKKDRLSSRDLVASLIGLEDRRWSCCGKSGRGLTQNYLAWLLKPFKVYPATIRLEDGRTPKGYKRELFEPVWDRYLPHNGNQTATTPQPASTQEKNDFSSRHNNFDVAAEKCGKPASTQDCGGVAVEKREWDGVGPESDTFEPGERPCATPDPDPAAGARIPCSVADGQVDFPFGNSADQESEKTTAIEHERFEDENEIPW